MQVSFAELHFRIVMLLTVLFVFLASIAGPKDPPPPSSPSAQLAFPFMIESKTDPRAMQTKAKILQALYLKRERNKGGAS
jgi:hypothetical protein